MNRIAGPLALMTLRPSHFSAMAAHQGVVIGLAVFMAVGTTAASAALPALSAGGTSATPRLAAPPTTETAGTETAGRKVAEVHRLSGLTWEELARAMGVTRRTLHLWANGRPIGAANEERLARLLAAVRAVDRGTARATRAVIMTPVAGRPLPLDLLIESRFNDFVAAAGRGHGRPDGPALPLSEKARTARTPPSPVALMGAVQDDQAGTAVARPLAPGKAVRKPPSRA